MGLIKFLLTFTILFQVVSAKEIAISPPPSIPQEFPVESPFIMGVLINQLGNQMAQIAATISLAIDHGAVSIFPDLIELEKWNTHKNYQYVFWRLNTSKPERPVTFIYDYHDLPYKPTPYQPDMVLCGNFQSEKYFSHNKKEIIKLFEPHPSIVKYLYKKHRWLKKKRNTVAVHVRAYYPYNPIGPDGQGVLPFLGFDYFEQAILSFPKESTFVVFSDNIELCKQNLSHISRKFIYIDNQEHYLDLFMMSLCEHNIISNSSFSWWGAYLNKNPQKIVIAPGRWFTPESGLDSSDIIPEGWVVLD